jgi:hypothetical protein
MGADPSLLAKLEEFGFFCGELKQPMANLRESTDALRKKEELVPVPNVGDVDPSEQDALETQSIKLMNECAAQSGQLNYQSLDKRRKVVLAKLEKLRTLTRWEYINLYGYDQWCSYCEEFGIAEDAETAEKPWFRNYYECPDDGEGNCAGETWETTHSATCNDRCQRCNKEIEPYKSDRLDFDTGQVIEAGTDCRIGSV